jgi:hypothetical protein
MLLAAPEPTATPATPAPGGAPLPAPQAATVVVPDVAADIASPAARVALALQAALLGSQQADDAAQAGVRVLAARLGFTRVSLALADGLALRLVAVSDGSRPDDPTPANARLLAALARPSTSAPPSSGPRHRRPLPACRASRSRTARWPVTAAARPVCRWSPAANLSAPGAWNVPAVRRSTLPMCRGSNT